MRYPQVHETFSLTGSCCNPSERTPITFPQGYLNPLIHLKANDTQLKHVKNNSWPGLILKDDLLGGFGLFAAKDFSNGDIICHYGGVLLDSKSYKEDSDSRLDKFLLQVTLNDTHWYFNHYEDTEFSHGKMINHSKECGNVIKKVYEGADYQPVVFFKATTQIKSGEQLLYNYGKKYRELPSCVPHCKKCLSKCP
jgi:hypothetical protein